MRRPAGAHVGDQLRERRRSASAAEMVLKIAAVTFLVGIVLVIGIAIWQANDPSDDIFEAGPNLCPSGTELHDTGREASRTCVPLAGGD